MNLKYQNILLKLAQSSLGFVLIAIQSQVISRNDLGTLVIAQGMIIVVSLFDFGFGVKLTTWIVEVLEISSVSNSSQKKVAQRLLHSRRLEIYLIAFLQSIVFGMSFLLLNFKLTSKIDLIICSIFTLSVFLQSIGNNFGRIPICTGQINLLVKLQSAGAFISFCGGLISLKTNFNLEISIFAICFSSAFIGMASMWPERKGSTEYDAQLALAIDKVKNTRDTKLNLSIQISQIFQFSMPFAVQFFVIEFFESTGVVAYFICQRLFGAIGNALSSDTQLNFTLKQDSSRLTMQDIFRFKRHLIGFILVSMSIGISLVYTWGIVFPNIPSLKFQDLMSFIPLGICVFVDQAIRIRLYKLNHFFREMFSNVVLVVILIIFVCALRPHSFLSFNTVIGLSYFMKFIATLNVWEKYFTRPSSI